MVVTDVTLILVVTLNLNVQCALCQFLINLNVNMRTNF
jgi:hypothetical protein